MDVFNIDLLKYTHNHHVNTFVNLMYSYTFYPCIDRPTRVCSTKNGTSISVIDNNFTNDIEHKITSGKFGDRSIRSLSKFYFKQGFDNKYIKKLNKLTRQLKPHNIKSFKNFLSLANWDYITSDYNPETWYSNFLHKTTEVLCSHCPVKSM